MDLLLFNELISLATIKDSISGIDGNFQAYENGSSILVFENEAVKRHKEIFEQTYFLNKKVSLYSSLKSYIDYLLPIIRIKLNDKTGFKQQDYVSLLNYFECLPIENISVWHEITGIELKKETKISLGAFTIIDWEAEKEIIEKELVNNPKAIGYDRKYKYLIGVHIKARDFQKAHEIANSYFSAFEAIVHLILGYPDKSYFVTIINNDNGLIGEYIAYSIKLGLSGTSSGWKRYTSPILIDDDYFKDKKFSSLFQLITDHSRTDLQDRLFLTSLWLGQAIRNNDIIDGYLKAIIAIEILFSTNINGVMSPSIVYQISESIALLLGKNVENCLAIEKEIKDLYGKRSGIVHNGSTSVIRNDYLKACNYGRAALLKIINTKKYHLNKIHEVLEILKTLKYS